MLRIFHQIESLILMAIPLSIIKRLFEKYLFSDWDFLSFLCVLIAVDTFFGLWKHWRYGSISSKGFAAFFTKIIIYFGFLIVCNSMVHYTIEGHQNLYFSWFDDLTYSAIVVREAISVIENIGAINKNLLPTWILSRLKQFDSSGNFNSEK